LDERTVSICLNSKGGSFSEGIKLAELLFNRGLTTVIEYGSECYSACATIFMAGVIPEQIAPMRKLSVGGILGFHAPYLSLPEANYSKEEMESATQALRLSILALVRLSSKKTSLNSSEFIKKSLITKILEKGPNDVFFIKTIYDAARWDILLFDAEQHFRKPGNIDLAKNTCINFHSANMDEDSPLSMDLTLKPEKYTSKFYHDDVRILVLNAKTNDVVCELYPRTLRNSPRMKFFACSHDFRSSKSFGDCREYLTAPAFRIGNHVSDFLKYDPNLLLLRFKK
jgi:hypothetical protein